MFLKIESVTLGIETSIIQFNTDLSGKVLDKSIKREPCSIDIMYVVGKMIKCLITKLKLYVGDNFIFT